MKLSKLLGLVLAVACAVMLGFAALVASGLVTEVRPGSAEIDAPDRGRTGELPAQAFALDEIDAYAVIAERPLFNETRLPEIDEGGEEIEGPDTTEEQIANIPLDVSVRGIIITPDMRLALLTDNRNQETMRIQEGMPLEGDLAGWTLTRIEPRKLVFDDDGSGQAEVELQVHSRALAGGPAPTVRNATEDVEATAEEAQTADAEVDQSSAEARAEEIRRRVAERREQLRAEAERRRQLQQSEEE